MSCSSDKIKLMMALGRQFTIGSLYNYATDVISPNVRLWDPDDVALVSDIQTERKKTVKVLKLTTEQDSSDEEEDATNTINPWISKLGLDDHSAMSIAAGLLRPPFVGAWQLLQADCGPQLAIYSSASCKKVSVDPTQLDIIYRPEKLISCEATHVVVAISYGLEAFCLFSPQHKDKLENHQMSDNDKSVILKYAELFANGLLDEEKQLELEQNKEDSGEENIGCLFPPDFECILYSDLIRKKKENSWTLKPLGEQLQVCKNIMDHAINKAVPLKVCLYPLSKLIPTEASIAKMPEKYMDISRTLVNLCQTTMDLLQRFRIETDLLISELDKSHWIPAAVSQRAKDFQKLLNTFSAAVRGTLSEWTVSVRRDTGKEETMAEIMEAIETKSPFGFKEMQRWLNDYRRQIKILEIVSHLPSVELISDAEYLKKEIKRVGYTVVLHLPNFIEPSDRLIQEMDNFVTVFPSHLSEWTQPNDIPSVNFSIVHAAQDFSDWVTQHNRDAINMRYFIFYGDVESIAGHRLPSIHLYKNGMTISKNFLFPQSPGQVGIVKNHRGSVTLSWESEEIDNFSSYLLRYRSSDEPDDIWKSISTTSNVIKINFLQSGESYVFRVAVVTLGGRSSFGPNSEEVIIDPVCPAPTDLHCRYATDTSITVSWNHQEYEKRTEVEDENASDNEEYHSGKKYHNEGEEEDDSDNEEDENARDFEEYQSSEEEETANGNEEEDESDNEESLKVVSYSIDCWADGKQESSFIQRSTTSKIITLEPLVPHTNYCIQVTAMCIDLNGSTFFSPPSVILISSTLKDPERAAHIVRRVSEKSPANCGIDAYNLPVKKHRGTPTPGVGHYIFGERTYLALAGKHRQRTILMLGATGSGKSTLINAMVNYVLGVEWEDDFRFKLIDEPTSKSQAHSQTDLVTTYDLYEIKGSRLGFSLTIVDTPGFGDTRGLEKDKQIMEQLQRYFQCRHGIQQLEAVCFVVQSSLPRLTATQQYIFDSILSIFGQDIYNNIRLMVTFADSALPPVLGAVQEAGIPSPIDPSNGLPLHHKFNNSIFFTSNKGNRQTNEFNRTYFEMAVEGFDRFFEDLTCMEAKSLTLTREVLEERKKLEALVEGLEMKTEEKLVRVDELEQIKKILTENQEEMDANTDFEFEALVPKSIDISGTGQFTTNCENCKTTCHFPCRQSSDDHKHKCSVMDSNGYCMICKCHWRNHFNLRYRYDMVKKKVTRSSDAIRQSYQGAVKERLTNEQLLVHIEKDIKRYEKNLVELMQATHPCIRRLNEIALRPHPFSTPDYIDLMVEAEKQEHRSGYQQRIATLQKLRKMAEMTAKLIEENEAVSNKRI